MALVTVALVVVMAVVRLWAPDERGRASWGWPRRPGCVRRRGASWRPGGRRGRQVFLGQDPEVGGHGKDVLLVVRLPERGRPHRLDRARWQGLSGKIGTLGSRSADQQAVPPKK